MRAPEGENETRKLERAFDRITDTMVSGYGFDVGKHVSSRLKLDLVRALVDRSKVVCDVGCGNGLYMRLLAPETRRIIGIDYNLRMLQEAKQAFDRDGVRNAELLRASAGALPLASGSCDVAFSYSTLLVVPDIETALAEIRRILRPGGKAVLDIAGRVNLSGGHWDRWYRSQGHFGIHAYSWKETVALLGRHGLSIEAAHALSFCDQWKYLRGAHRLPVIDRLFHASPVPGHNLDYRISNWPWLSRMASRWYCIVSR